MFWIWNRRNNFVFNNFWIFLSVITICIILRQTFHGNGQTSHFGDLSHTLVVSCGFFPAQCSTSRLRLYTFAQVGHFVLSACFFFFFHPILLSFLRPASMEKQIFISFCSEIFIFYLFGRWVRVSAASLHPLRVGNSSCRALHGKSSSTDFRELVDRGWGG